MEQLVRLRAKLVVNIPRNSLLDRDKTSWKILVEREKKTWRQHPTYHTFTHTIYLLSRRKTTKFVLFNLYSRHSSPDHFFPRRFISSIHPYYSFVDVRQTVRAAIIIDTAEI